MIFVFSPISHLFYYLHLRMGMSRPRLQFNMSIKLARLIRVTYFRSLVCWDIRTSRPAQIYLSNRFAFSHSNTIQHDQPTSKQSELMDSDFDSDSDFVHSLDGSNPVSCCTSNGQQIVAGVNSDVLFW